MYLCTGIKKCPDGGIGRRAGLKHQWSNIHPGSTPGLGTKKESSSWIFNRLTLFFCLNFLHMCKNI